MADGAVSFLLENLTRLLDDEVKLLSGVKGKVQSLAKELRFIDIFLKSSEGKRNDKIVKEVMRQIRDVAYEAEDAVDTYVANVIEHRNRNMLGKLLHFIDHGLMFHDVNSKIDKIKGKIEEIYRNRDRYDIGQGEFSSGDIQQDAESLHKRRREVEEEDVVGLVHDSNVVIGQLMTTDSHRNVVSIIGMGGLGKTTLARKIYNNNQVKKVFPRRAWGYVSNDYNARELLFILLKCLKRPTSKYQHLSDEELKKEVRKCLYGKKYLVVLDDIWKTQAWDELKVAFPDDHGSGSRILITSRIREVAFHARTTFVYDLPFLEKHDSWKLFSKKAFPGEECPSSLEDLGKSIVERCGGLPLAILVLSGIVAKKDKSQRERWLRSIKDHVIWHISQNNENVMDILKLSYDNLPQRFKPCFLYFGIYPEDHEIPVREMIKMWIAEGFIQSPQETGRSDAPQLEDVADSYLDELVDRSLIQVVRRRSDEGVKTCSIHDLLRDLCISESKVDKFLEVGTKSNIDSLNNPRRLSMQCSPQFYLSSNESKKSRTRSLVIFDKDEMYLDNIMKIFKLVRVLKLEKSKHHDFKVMIHLRYLKIDGRDDYWTTIPASIFSLWNLQTLDVRCLCMDYDSIGMWKLKRLRHLYMSEHAMLPKDMSGVHSKTMWNLQTLCWVAPDPRTMSLVDKDNFPNLRKLGLIYKECNGDMSLVSEQLRRLHHLSNLRTLKISGKCNLPSDANEFPINITKITLVRFGSVHSRILNALGWLPNLQILKIYYGSIIDPHLNCSAEEFPQLQVFHMLSTKVKRWGLEKGAMPRLQHLVIDNCYLLTELPEELWFLTNLSEVHVKLAKTELANHLQNVEVKNGCKLIVSNSV